MVTILNDTIYVKKIILTIHTIKIWLYLLLLISLHKYLFMIRHGMGMNFNSIMINFTF
jgi:hypothetical protein